MDTSSRGREERMVSFMSKLVERDLLQHGAHGGHARPRPHKHQRHVTFTRQLAGTQWATQEIVNDFFSRPRSGEEATAQAQLASTIGAVGGESDAKVKRRPLAMVGRSRGDGVLSRLDEGQGRQERGEGKLEGLEVFHHLHVASSSTKTIVVIDVNAFRSLDLFKLCPFFIALSKRSEGSEEGSARSCRDVQVVSQHLLGGADHTSQPARSWVVADNI
eukprot:scaffold3595_cov235-Ochromonas_danica.AAC.26